MHKNAILCNSDKCFFYEVIKNACVFCLLVGLCLSFTESTHSLAPSTQQRSCYLYQQNGPNLVLTPLEGAWVNNSPTTNLPMIQLGLRP